MQHRDRVIIDKVLSEIHIAQQMMLNVEFENFYANEEKKRAVCMTVINIGELVKNLSHEFLYSVGIIENTWRNYIDKAFLKCYNQNIRYEV